MFRNVQLRGCKSVDGVVNPVNSASSTSHSGLCPQISSAASSLSNGGLVSTCYAQLGLVTPLTDTKPPNQRQSCVDLTTMGLLLHSHFAWDPRTQAPLEHRGRLTHSANSQAVSSRIEFRDSQSIYSGPFQAGVLVYDADCLVWGVKIRQAVSLQLWPVVRVK